MSLYLDRLVSMSFIMDQELFGYIILHRFSLKLVLTAILRHILLSSFDSNFVQPVPKQTVKKRLLPFLPFHTKPLESNKVAVVKPS